jgi:hypothetical protein
MLGAEMRLTRALGGIDTMVSNMGVVECVHRFAVYFEGPLPPSQMILRWTRFGR